MRIRFNYYFVLLALLMTTGCGPATSVNQDVPFDSVQDSALTENDSTEESGNQDGNCDDEHLNAICDQIEAGNYTEAIRLCDNAIEKNPTDYLAYVDRSECHLIFDELEKALADANKAIQLAPQKHEGYEIRSEVWSWREQPEKSIADLTKAMQLKPDYVGHYTDRGYEFEMLGRYEDALNDYIYAIKLDENDAIAWNNYASIRSMAPDARLRDGSDAVKAAIRAVKLAKDDEETLAYCWDTLGSAYAEVGNFKKAIRSAERASKIADQYEMEGIMERIGLYYAGEPARLPVIN